MMEQIKAKVMRSKLWAAIAGAAISIVGAALGVDTDKILLAVAPLMTYIGGEAFVDAVRKKAK